MTQLIVPSQSSTILQVRSARAFMNDLFPEPRGFEIRLWDGTRITTSSEATFTLIIRSPGALRRMFRPPLELSLSEAFIRGDFDIEGDLCAVFDRFNLLIGALSNSPLTLLHRWLSLPGENTSAGKITRGPAHLSGARHSRNRDRAAVQFHYDVGNDFYALWLDKSMVYSCAYYPTGTDNLDTAQEQKLDLICGKLRLEPGERLLDIGCGWGGLLVYAAQHYGVTALGVTLSEQQQLLANQRLAAAGLNRCAVKLLDYRELEGMTFDKIASVGMFEHVGRDHLPEYFDCVYRLLKPGGLFLNHGIAAHPFVSPRHRKSLSARVVEHFMLGSGSFVQRYVFPDAELVQVSEATLFAERCGFEVWHVENLREHDALTLRQWGARLDEHRDEAIHLTDEATYRTWKLYLAAAAYAFEAGHLNVHQSLLYKPENGPGSAPRPDSRRCCGLHNG